MRVQGSLGFPNITAAQFSANDGLGLLAPADPSRSLFVQSDNSVGSSGEDARALGYSLRELRQEMRLYQALEPIQKRNKALECALAEGKIDDLDPIWLKCSLFGWHAMEFLELASDPRFGLGRDNLVVVDYGAGSHGEYGHAVKIFKLLNAPGTPLLREYEPLKRADNALFQGKGAVYEPKGLMALFCGGRKNGHVYVVEQDPEIGKLLRSPRTSFLNSWEVYAAPDPVSARLLERYWEALSQGRTVSRQAFGSGLGGKILRGSTFSLSREEMSRIHFTQADLAVERVSIPGGADLSVWLNSYYFMSPNLRIVSLCRVIKNAKEGGLILTDLFPTDQNFELDVAGLGLEVVKPFSSPIKGNGVDMNSVLFRKVQDLDSVRAISQLSYNS